MRRLLPEAAYDFFTRDSRDGEEGPTCHTLAEARAEQRQLRKALPVYKRSCVQVVWEVNERKVLRLLNAKQRDPRSVFDIARDAATKAGAP